MVAMDQPVVAEAIVPVQSGSDEAARSAPATPDEELARAQALVAANRVDEARALLLRIERRDTMEPRRANEVQFLLGMLDMQAGDYESATSRFRRILVNEPGALRVRLEMGRALFLGGRYGDAERQFMLARAGSVPEGVLANIDRFLAAIRRNKTFSYGFSLAITPDSNLNAAPATDTVTLYGLPFQLSRDAKAQSGVGLTVGAHAQWSPRLGKQLSWRTGARLYRAQYRKTEFDDMTISAFTGAHLALKRADINLLGQVARRWYGNRGYSVIFGPVIDATYFVDPRFGLGINVSVSRIEYDRNTFQDGTARSIGASFFFTPSATSFLRGSATVAKQDARDKAFAFKSLQLGLSYIREFAGGLTLGLSPSYAQLRYDEPLGAFAKARRDRQFSTQVSVLFRQLDIHGFTPKLAYTLSKNDSNIDLYRFKRSRFEVGFTSSF